MTMAPGADLAPGAIVSDEQIAAFCARITRAEATRDERYPGGAVIIA